MLGPQQRGHYKLCHVVRAAAHMYSRFRSSERGLGDQFDTQVTVLTHAATTASLLCTYIYSTATVHSCRAGQSCTKAYKLASVCSTCAADTHGEASRDPCPARMHVEGYHQGSTRHVQAGACMGG